MVRSVNAGQLGQRLLELGVVELAEQHLAVAGRVQRDALAHPVVRLERRGPGHLVEVEGAGLGATVMFTVSPVSAASCRQTGRASVTTSSRAVVAPASRRLPTPSR